MTYMGTNIGVHILHGISLAQSSFGLFGQSSALQRRESRDSMASHFVPVLMTCLVLLKQAQALPDAGANHTKWNMTKGNGNFSLQNLHGARNASTKSYTGIRLHACDVCGYDATWMACGLDGYCRCFVGQTSRWAYTSQGCGNTNIGSSCRRICWRAGWNFWTCDADGQCTCSDSLPVKMIHDVC